MHLIKKYIIVVSGIIISRLFGFFRELLMANILGTGPLADSFNAAFRFPNTFRRLFAEGAISSSFVAIFSKKFKKSLINAKQFSEEVFNFIFVLILFITIIIEIFMPSVVSYIIAPGFREDKEKFYITIQLAIIMFPYLLCMSLASIMGGILNSLNYYFISAASPVFLNIILIFILFISWIYNININDIVILLAWGVTFSGIIQFFILWFSVKKIGIDIKFKIPRWKNKIKRLIKLAMPATIAGSITQINLLINTNIASSKPGAISSLVYADKLYQLPLGILGIAMATILLPELSSILKDSCIKKIMDIQNRSLEFILMLCFPISVILLYMSQQIVCFIFERGRFDSYSTFAVSEITEIYSLGLPAFVLIKTFISIFFAREDTKSPMILSIFSAVINIILVVFLFPKFSTKGIAISEIISGWINAISLLILLSYKGYWMNDKILFKNILKYLFSSLIMAYILSIVIQYYSFYLSKESDFIIRSIALFIILFGSIISYFIFLFFIKIIMKILR